MKKTNNNLISIKVRNISYDVDDCAEVPKRLPRNMTLKASQDMVDILYDYNADDIYGNMDESEFIGELIEEKVGIPVLHFEYKYGI